MVTTYETRYAATSKDVKAYDTNTLREEFLIDNLMQNHLAVISPLWSTHCGFGISNNTFIWAMAGENLHYDDMDIAKINDLR